MIINNDSAVKMQYRSGLGIVVDVLDVCMGAGTEGALISEISRKANLSHFTALESCKKLVRARMLLQVRTERRHIFVVTEKGILFFNEFQKFFDALRDLDIRY